MDVLKWIKKQSLQYKNDRPSLDFSRYGTDFWECIFLHCDYKTLEQLYKSCKFFHVILSSSSFWLRMCENEGVPLPPINWRRFISNHRADEPSTSNSPQNINYRLVYRHRPYYSNLARPLRADDTIEKLESLPFVELEHGGDGFKLETDDMTNHAVIHPEIPICLATSYGWCRRIHYIRLRDFGVEDWVMDKIRPKITVSEMQICRRDCAANYEVVVQLLKENEQFDRNVLLPRFQRQEKQWNQWAGGQAWETVSFEFSEYPAGIRVVAIFTQGKDGQFWAGHYGAKFANTKCVLSFPDEMGYKKDEEFADPEKKFLGDPNYVRARSLRNIGWGRRFPTRRF